MPPECLALQKRQWPVRHNRLDTFLQTATVCTRWEFPVGNCLGVVCLLRDVCVLDEGRAEQEVRLIGHRSAECLVGRRSSDARRCKQSNPPLLHGRVLQTTTCFVAPPPSVIQRVLVFCRLAVTDPAVFGARRRVSAGRTGRRVRRRQAYRVRL